MYLISWGKNVTSSTGIVSGGTREIMTYLLFKRPFVFYLTGVRLQGLLHTAAALLTSHLRQEIGQSLRMFGGESQNTRDCFMCAACRCCLLTNSGWPFRLDLSPLVLDIIFETDSLLKTI